MAIRVNETLTGEKALELVLKLNELTREGKLTWTDEGAELKQKIEVITPEGAELRKSIEQISPEGVNTAALKGLVDDSKFADRMAESPSFAAGIIVLFGLVLLRLMGQRYITTYQGMNLRLVKFAYGEHKADERAMLLIVDDKGEKMGEFPQSSALDDLFRTVERRTKTDRPSNPPVSGSTG